MAQTVTGIVLGPEVVVAAWPAHDRFVFNASVVGAAPDASTPQCAVREAEKRPVKPSNKNELE